MKKIPTDEEIHEAELRVKRLRLRELIDEAGRLSAEIDAHLGRRRAPSAGDGGASGTPPSHRPTA